MRFHYRNVRILLVVGILIRSSNIWGLCGSLSFVNDDDGCPFDARWYCEWMLKLQRAASRIHIGIILGSIYAPNPESAEYVTVAHINMFCIGITTISCHFSSHYRQTMPIQQLIDGIPPKRHISIIFIVWIEFTAFSAICNNKRVLVVLSCTCTWAWGCILLRSWPSSRSSKTSPAGACKCVTRTAKWSRFRHRQVDDKAKNTNDGYIRRK